MDEAAPRATAHASVQNVGLTVMVEPDEAMARASGRRRVVALSAALLTVALLVGYFAARHRVTEGSLGYALAASAGDKAYTDRCEQRGTGWRCFIRDTSGPNGYRVILDGRCWQATRLNGVAGGGGSSTMFPSKLDGCIGILDQLRLRDVLSPLR